MKIVLPSTRRAGSGLDDERLLPLINVVFLLLVYFMLAGALSSPAAFRVDPPKSSEAGSADAGTRARPASVCARRDDAPEGSGERRHGASAGWYARAGSAVLCANDSQSDEGAARLRRTRPAREARAK